MVCKGFARWAALHIPPIPACRYLADCMGVTAVPGWEQKVRLAFHRTTARERLVPTPCSGWECIWLVGLGEGYVAAQRLVVTVWLSKIAPSGRCTATRIRISVDGMLVSVRSALGGYLLLKTLGNESRGENVL
jgi:hypothetical protein